jgi:hypothetical protein
MGADMRGAVGATRAARCALHGTAHYTRAFYFFLLLLNFKLPNGS